jgi:hypothetical protein
MKTYVQRPLGAIALVVLMGLATPVLADELFGDWDLNKDTGIDNSEFGTGFGKNGVYDNWDADHDGQLSRDEFNEGLFTGYDRNRNGRIEEPEFGDYGDDIGDGGLFDV